MNQNLTDITIVLDRSGSMNSCRKATIDGYNEFLKAQRASSVGECRVSLVQFDDKYEPVFDSRLVAEAPELTDDTFQPRGMTALYDAICKTIVDTGARYERMPEQYRPGKVLIVVITDGGENQSKEFKSASQVKEKIEHQKSKYLWDFVFIGANQDAILTAKDFGIDAGKSMTYVSNDTGTQSTFASTAGYVLRSRGMAGAAVALQANQFTKEDRDAQNNANTPGTSAGN